MESWTWLLTDPLWRTALTVIPLVLGVAAICHFVPLLPATRHTLWLVVLLWLIASPLLPASSLPGPLARLMPHGAIPSEQPVLAVVPPKQETAPPAAMSISPGEALGPAPRAADTVPGAAARAPEIPATSEVFVYSAPRPRVSPLAPPVPAIVLEAPAAEPYWVEAPTEAPAPRAFPPRIATAGTQDTGSPEPPPSDHKVESSDRTPAAAPIQPPTHALTSTPSAGTAPPQTAAWRTWLSGLLAVRDALLRLPSMPVNVWLGGMALLLTTQFVRCLRARCVLRAAVMAPESVGRMVREVAGALGMRQVPETLMVPAHLSPMITCGRRPRLVLPRALWGQLDHVSRRAVICHELAHLRRRDHWIRWCQLAACALYWWHPVAWWVRRCLSEEAEMCCDAWVTWLMPQQRRAYAETLLKTKQYVCAQDARVPAVGIGVTTRRARRFARRLKMVMTANTRPGLSVAGILLALGVALCGWLTAPVWACPPESKAAKADQPAPVAVAIPAEAPHAVIVATETGDDDDDAPQGTYEKHMAAKKAPKAKSPKAPKAAQPFVFSFNGGKGTGSGVTAWPAQPSTPPTTPEPGGRPGRDDLERRMERLERQLERLSARLEQMSSGPGQSIPGRGPRASGGGVGRAQTAPLAREEEDGNVITRVYKLPDGKRDALIEFLRRDDVPVRISPAPVDGGIEVHGTARQHEVFKAFIDLINPSERRGAALEPASPLMGLRNRLSDLSLLKALEAPRSDGDSSRLSRELVERLTREKTSLFEAQKRQIEAQQNNLRRQAEQLRAQAEHMRQEAERLRENAQQLMQKAQEMRERSDASQNEHEQQAAEREAQSVENEARSTEEHAEQIEASTDSIDERAVAFESQAEELEGALDVPEP